ncbi:MAG: glutamine amidotransferase, partial [Chthoniobacteraceae bacterium]
MTLLDSIPRTFEPALPWPWLGALGAIGLFTAIITARRARFPVATAGLQLLALAWLLLVLANPVRRGEVPVPAPTGGQVVLLDVSASMSLGGAHPRWRKALEWATPLLDRNEARLVTFDAGCDLSGVTPNGAKGAESRLAQALDRISSGALPPAHIVVVSDGVFDDPREIERALARLGERHIAVSTHVVGRDEVAPNLFLRRIEAPRFAPAESQVNVGIEVGAIGLPPETRTTLRLLGEDRRVLAEREWSGGPIELAIPFGLRAEQITAQLTPVAGEVSDADNTATFRIEPLHPKIRVFYAEGSRGPNTLADGRLASARFFPVAFQRAGDIECDLFQMPEQDRRGQPIYFVSGFDEDGHAVLDPTRTIPSDRDGWWRYDVIIISDIDRQMLLPHMETVRALVAEGGGGFLMCGGNHSFDTGYYDQTVWERLLPVDCLQFGYGHGGRRIDVGFPDTIRAHPILQITPSRALNDRILGVHPQMRGYHDIRRIKPGAVTLATVASSGAPLAAVQDYGRGRTMAFLSDPAGGWGEDYQGVWGPALLADDAANAVPGEREFIEDPSLAVNEFYNRFWVNSIRWLAAHSVRRQERMLLGRAATATVRPGERLVVSAELRTGEAADAPDAWSVGVRAGAGPAAVTGRFFKRVGDSWNATGRIEAL